MVEGRGGGDLRAAVATLRETSRRRGLTRRRRARQLGARPPAPTPRRWRVASPRSPPARRSATSCDSTVWALTPHTDDTDDLFAGLEPAAAHAAEACTRHPAAEAEDGAFEGCARPTRAGPGTHGGRAGGVIGAVRGHPRRRAVAGEPKPPSSRRRNDWRTPGSRAPRRPPSTTGWCRRPTPPVGTWPRRRPTSPPHGPRARGSGSAPVEPGLGRLR